MHTLSVGHFIAGAHERTRLVADERDRATLLACVARAAGGGLLAFCILDTHLHVVVEGPESATTRRFERALADYARAFNKRRPDTPLVLRGKPVRVPKDGPFETARTIKYTHENPMKTTPPLAASEELYPWSSAPVFAGLVADDRVNAARARDVVSGHERWALPSPRRLEGLEPSTRPSALLDTLLRASARACSVLAEDMTSASGAHELGRARAVFARLARLESYNDGQIADALGRTRQRVTQLAAMDVDLVAVRRARTLARLKASERELVAAAAP